MVLAAAALILRPIRDELLREAGRALVAADAPVHADEIVIAVDADGAGVLEAADLAHAHLSQRVAVFADPPDATDREFLHRGLPYHDAAALETRQLRLLGVSDVEVIPRPVEGTHDEGGALLRWCAERGYRTILFVSTADHSRRTRRVLHRELSGSSVVVHVVYSKYSRFDPDAWWHAREGVRVEIVEGEKLLLDLLRHPFS